MPFFFVYVGSKLYRTSFGLCTHILRGSWDYARFGYIPLRPFVHSIKVLRRGLTQNISFAFYFPLFEGL